jgi:2'-5' RNA ligase
MRVFFCLELDPALQRAIQALTQPLKKTRARVTWVKSENFHVTIKFLGEIEPKILPDLQEIGTGIAQALHPLSYALDRTGAFPDLERPRVIWIGASQIPEELRQLHTAIEANLEKLGFERERPFTAHITLGRVKDEDRARLAELSKAIQNVQGFRLTATANALTLMESQLTPGGSIYTPVFQLPFAGL